MTNYKESGVDWIGQIPENWKIVRLKDYWENKKEIAKEKASEYERLALTLNGVIKRSKEDSEGLQPKEFETYQILEANDFVFKMIDLQNISTSRVGLSSYTGLVSPAYIRFSPKNKEQEVKFTYYYLMSLYYNCVYNSLGGDGVRSALNSTDMGNMKCPYPSPEKQKKIVEFLDKKCSEIDKLIEVENQQIEKLKEYRTSVVFNALTKSLIKERELKDCNLPWISKMPLGWNVCKIKHIAKLETGSTPPTTNPGYFDGKINWFTPGDLKDLEVSDSARKITDTAVADGYKPYPLFSTLLIGIGGTAGKVAYMTAEGYSNQQITALIPKSIENKYLFYLMNSLSQYIKDNAHYTTLPIINNSYLGNAKVIIAPKNEQKEIVEYLDDKCMKIVNLISLKNKKIKWIQEYKKSIIYEYVTGKKEIV